MGVARVVLKRDVKKYVFSREFLFLSIILPMMIIYALTNVSMEANTSSPVKVGIISNDFYPQVYSFLVTDSSFTIVPISSAQIIIGMTEKNFTTTVFFTGVINLESKNPNFSTVSQRLFSDLGIGKSTVVMKYGAVIVRGSQKESINYDPSKVLKYVSSVLTVSALFVFFIMMTSISTVVTSVINDRKTKFLYTIMSAPIRKESYVFGKVSAGVVVSVATIVIYSVMFSALYVLGGENVASSETVSINIIQPWYFIVSFASALFSMLFLILLSMLFVFLLPKDKTAVMLSNTAVDVLVMPAFFVSILSNVINFLSTSGGKALFLLDPATSPIMVMYYLIVGSTKMVLVAFSVPVVATLITLVFVKRSLEDLK